MALDVVLDFNEASSSDFNFGKPVASDGMYSLIRIDSPLWILLALTIVLHISNKAVFI